MIIFVGNNMGALMLIRGIIFKFGSRIDCNSCFGTSSKKMMDKWNCVGIYVCRRYDTIQNDESFCTETRCGDNMIEIE